MLTKMFQFVVKKLVHYLLLNNRLELLAFVKITQSKMLLFQPEEKKKKFVLNLWWKKAERLALRAICIH